jgi:hypothetical protein
MKYDFESATKEEEVDAARFPNRERWLPVRTHRRC